MGDEYRDRARREVAIARTRDIVTELRECLTGSGVAGVSVSIRVPGADLFVMAGGDLPTDHVLCDLDGLPVPEVPGYRNYAGRQAHAHALVHRDGARVVVDA